MGNSSKMEAPGEEYRGSRPVRGAFGRNKKRVSTIDARLARMSGKEFDMRRRMLTYVREGHLTGDEMIAALQ